MADFRRCIYALALVALFVGLTVSASAQQAIQCTSSLSTDPNVRAEGYSELLGDIVLDCVGGVPTPPNQSIPGINIAVNLDVNVTSQTTKVLNNIEFLESLLIIDEPNSASHENDAVVPQILNCGRTEAPDNLAAGAGVCSIIGQGANGAATLYNGTPGHPNVFQGRSLRMVTGQLNQVLFSSIPIDPPGTVCPASIATPGALCHRIIRITNIRGDATEKSVVVANVTQNINATLIISPPTNLPVDNVNLRIATVTLGLVGPALKSAQLAFVQCSSLAGQDQSGLVYTFKEGFIDAFKPKSLTQILANGTAKPSYSYTAGANPVTGGIVTNNQNVPGAPYQTESGFVNAGDGTAGDAPTNSLTGGPGRGRAFSNAGGVDTGIGLSGIATQGTRLIMRFSNIPAGSSVSVPNVVNLTNVITGGVGTTGVAVLISGTTSSGFGGTPLGAGTSNVAGTAGGVTYPGYAVYEVYFSNPGALEQLAVPLTVTGVPALPSNLPAPNVVAQIQGGFAPFYDSTDPVRRTAFAAGTENTAPVGVPNPPATLAIPRFLQIATATNLYAISRCSCNLLFPFVTNAPTTNGNYDTGIAIANTSLDPGNLAPTVYGFHGSAQAGPVQMWFYNRNAATPAEPSFAGQGNTQCTNATTPGSCSGTLANVNAGGMLTYVLSSGGWIQNDVATPGPPVLLGATGVTGGAFQGYIIAQARFQYCHGFAFIQKQGAGFESDQAFMGYLAIVLDQGGLARTGSIGEQDAH